MATSPYYSPLRYPGGKFQLIPYMRHLFDINKFGGRHYVEPFAGGASVALDLLFREYVPKVTINDKDPSIYAFWKSAVNDTEALVEMIESTPVSTDIWKEKREMTKNPVGVSDLDLGFATFFMNRCNRSGIISAGIIGGNKQEGQWKIDARYNKPELVHRIRKIGQYSSRIQVCNLDACELIDFVSLQLGKKFYYFDPPYYVKGQDLYLNYFKHEDHVRIRDKVSDLTDPWFMTYDNHPAIEEIYTDFRQKVYTLNYHAAVASKGSELMIYSDDIQHVI